MAGIEKFDEIWEVISANSLELTNNIISGAEAQERFVSAQVEVQSTAEDLKAAENRHKNAQKEFASCDSARSLAAMSIETAATQIAIAIADQPDLEPLGQTLGALVFARRIVSRNESPRYYEDLHQGRAALSSIAERLQPGEPVLYYTEKDQVVAGVTAAGSLVATPPNVVRRVHDSRTSVSLQSDSGSIEVTLPVAASAITVGEGLVKVEHAPKNTVLLSHRHRQGLEHLNLAATNDKWFIVGKEAITSKLNQLDPTEKFAALTALTAAEVHLPVEIDLEVKARTEDEIVSLVEFLASGAEEKVAKHVSSPDLSNNRTRVIVEDSPRAKVAENIDPASIRYMTETLGVSQSDLRNQVIGKLQITLKTDTSSLGQISRSLQSVKNLDDLLDIIFPKIS